MLATLSYIPSFRLILIVSAVLRVCLVIYSEWHDRRPGTIVKYTDVDYRVFSDATAFLLHSSEESNNIAKGLLRWRWVGDPYTRETYRYTPLLALLLAPNEWLHPAFGKLLFAACDIINGVLIYLMLLEGGMVPRASNKRPRDDLDAKTEEDVTARATLCAALHLLNPLVFSISTRGSSESVLATCVLGTLRWALRGQWDAAAVGLGLSTHWKVYPFVYGVACLGVIGSRGEPTAATWKGRWNLYVNRRTVRFMLLSAGTFVLLCSACYLVWGYPFLFESYLYHLHRRDHRHNFSPYFYLVYLTYPSDHFPDSPPNESPLAMWRRAARSPLASFVPQMVLVLCTGLLFGRRREDLAFAWFVQTAVFVTFNKVCTSQYFLWYLIFLPLVIPRLRISLWRAIAYAVVWLGTQAIWLEAAYRLEFLGQDVFLGLWCRCVLWLVGNAWVLGGIMSSYRFN